MERAEQDPVPEEHADEKSGTGGADSPEEVIGIDEEVVKPEKDPDEGPPGERGGG
ncbi:MAG: hypothetical protein ACRDL6_01340 [Solirubrobacterales bacterium]